MKRTHDNFGTPLFEFSVAVSEMMEPWTISLRRRISLRDYARSGDAQRLLGMGARTPAGTLPQWAIDEAREALQLLKERG